MTLRRDPAGDAETTVEFICNADQRCQIGVDQNGRLGKDRDAPAIGTADAPPALGRAGKLAPGNYEVEVAVAQRARDLAAAGVDAEPRQGLDKRAAEQPIGGVDAEIWRRLGAEAEGDVEGLRPTAAPRRRRSNAERPASRARP